MHVDHSAGFLYINSTNNDFLDNGQRDFGYAVFAHVVKGMDVVDRISAMPTGARDVPREAILIIDAKRL